MNRSAVKENFELFLSNLKNKTPLTYIFYFALFAVILSGICIRAKLYFLNPSLWNDEASLAFNVVLKSYLKLFAALKFRQVCPPMFLVATKFLLQISGQMNNIYTRDIVLRFLPAICGMISVPFFAFVLQKIFKQRCVTLLGAAILAFNYAAIDYSCEFKQYSVELFIAIVLIYSFWNFKYINSSLKRLLKYSFIFSIAPWFAYSALFFLPAGYFCIFYEIFKNKDFNKKKLLTFFALPFLSFLLFAFHYSRVRASEYSNMAYDWEKLIPSFFSFDNFFAMFSSKTYTLLPYIDAKVIFSLILVGLFIFIKKNYKDNLKILFLTLTPLLLLIAASFMHVYPYDLRLIIFIIPVYGIVLAQFGHLFDKIKCIDIFALLFVIAISIYQILLPVQTFASRHQNPGREYVLVMKSQNAQMKNILGFTRVGLWYLMPFLGQGDENVSAYNFSKEVWPERMKNVLDKMPANENLWLYAPHSYPLLEYDLITETKKYIESSPKFEIIQIWSGENNEGFLIKFKKISLK